MKKNKNMELYIHIPFCVQKCKYCDFLSAPVSASQQEAYLKALCWEIEYKSLEYQKYQIITIFFGGGTPSLVSDKWIVMIMETIRTCYHVTKDVEITIEVNPGTVDKAKLASYYSAGINRLSIGLQSALDMELQILGRVHNYGQFLDTYENARAVGYTNINLDIMSALPNQSLEEYRQTLEKILQLNPLPEHISAYSLIVEDGTVFGDQLQNGTLQLPDEECERMMYQETERKLLEMGFRRYEISNYAKEGYECRHNMGYWKRTEYVGFGIGAASLVDNQRFSNTTDICEYIDDPQNAAMQAENLTTKEQMEEFMFLGLRLMEGVSSKEFSTYFGCEIETVYGEVIRDSIKDGLLLQQNRNQDKHFRLTKRGIDVSNYCMARFLLE